MKPWAKILIAFIVGLLLGGAATGFYIHHCFTRAWVNSGNHNHVVDRMKSDLGLNADQADQIGKIFDEQKPQLDAIRLETNAKLKVLKDTTSDSIRKLLKPDQLKKFDDMRTKWEARESKNDKGWHIPGLPSGPPPGFGGQHPMCTSTPDK